MKTLSFIIITVIFLIPSLYAQVSSDFELSLDGWINEGDGTFYLENSTGNPGNCMRVDDQASGSMNFAIAPTQYLGSWSAATTSDSISADIFLHKINGYYITNNLIFIIEGPGGKATALNGIDPPLDVWTTFSVKMDSANWSVLSGTWENILAHVTKFSVQMEYIAGDEYERLDNVKLSFTPVVLPVAPVVCSGFEEGDFDGWTVTNATSVTHQTAGGYPGAYLRIVDGGSVSLAYAPYKYLGDWSALDNHQAEIHVDIKVTNIDGPAYFHDFFISLGGPGGTATFPVSNIIENAFNQWYTFVFPIDMNSWTMESGTWADLLNNVNQVIMVVEFIDGAEIVWMDNFCITNLPPVSDFTANKLIGFAGTSIQFSDISDGAVAWDWDFANGQSASVKNPEILFNSPGTFDIELMVSNYYGSSTETKEDYIEILPVDNCLKWEDDFEDNDISQLYNLKNGNWIEENGDIRQTTNHYVSGQLLQGCFAITGSPLWQGYNVSCDIKSTDNDHIGLVWNWQDESNMYMFYWNKQGSYRRLVKWVGGVETILAEDDFAYTTGTWYQIDIISNAGTHVLVVDGIEVFSVFDATFSNGHAGLFCSGNQVSYWDNFKIECYGIPFELSIFLEGSFNGSDMNTTLLNDNYLVTSNPYTNSPWNYSGSEGVLSFSNPDVVDWVLVDFRDATTAENAVSATSIARKTGLLLKDGQVISPYGGLPLYLNTEINNNLFILVSHRNHLGVLSANPAIEFGGSFIYDFNGVNQAYGTDAQKNLGGGMFGMYSGDINADGMINDLDKTLSWEINAGQSGYIQSDVNLDGQADNMDKNDLWILNNGQAKQYPD